MTTAVGADRRRSLGRRAESLLQHRRALLVVVLVGVLVRLAAALITSPSAVPQYEFGVIGENLADGRGYSYFAEQPDGTVVDDYGQTGRPLPSSYMPPLYSWTVAAAHVLFDGDATVRAVQAVNVLLAVAGILLFAALANRLFGRSTATLAAAGYALFPPLVYQATQFSASNLYIPVEIGALLALLVLAQRRTVAAAALVGLALGVLCLLRAEAVLFLALAAVWTWWFCRRDGARALRLAAVVLVVGAVLPAVWLLRTSLVLDQPVLTITTSGGYNLWVGNHTGASGSQKEISIGAAGLAEQEALEQRTGALPAETDYEVRRDAEYRRAALDHIRERPLEVLARDAKKLVMFLTVDVYDDRASHPVYVGGTLALHALGVVGALRRRLPKPETALLAGYLGLAALVATVFFTLARYQLPLTLLAILFSAALVAGWTSRPADARASS